MSIEPPRIQWLQSVDNELVNAAHVVSLEVESREIPDSFGLGRTHSIVAHVIGGRKVPMLSNMEGISGGGVASRVLLQVAEQLADGEPMIDVDALYRAVSA